MSLTSEVDSLRAEVARLEERDVQQREEEQSKMKKLIDSLAEAHPEDETILIDAAKVDPVITRLVESANESCQTAKRLRSEKRLLVQKAREFEDQLKWLASVAKTWLIRIPEEKRNESFQDVLRKIEDITARSVGSLEGVVEEEKETEELKAVLEAEKDNLSRLQMESAKKIQKLQVTIAAQEAELAKLRHSTQFPARIADRTRSEDENDLSNSKFQRLLKRNQDLERKLDAARARTSPDVRVLQNRCDILEAQVERLEGERSENIVRATVAEEQVAHLSVN